LKKEKFFGICIPIQYEGLGFSASAHSEIIHKLSSKSIPLAITTMVPNSLGPAELLIHYGTEKQKEHYLPRLARGEDIPCFGLTESNAGSDAGSIQAVGVLFKGTDGALYIRLNWKKRYITLGAVSTILGLAVKILDPENLLSKGRDLGITCVLVPSSLEGVRLGLRHNPLGVPFINSPIEGEDVVVSVEQVIGGLSGIGNGWKMLMECLAAGRSISLPTYSTGASKKILRATSAYAKIRQQFGVPIWRFEGVDEVLAEMTAMTYILDASRLYTVGSLDKGIKPSVVSAITKYHSTEMHRTIATKAMDIWGGAGISLGTRNLIARYYTSAPISITVEGANILTRSMIIFGQGAIRCHPFAYQEIKSLQENDIVAFDKAFFAHIGRVIQNICRLSVLTFTRAFFVKTPASRMSSYYKKLTWASTSFVVMSEVAMMLYGGKLKFKEKLAGRFADILSWMYLITATLRRYESTQSKEEESVVEYALQLGFQKIEEAFQGIFKNIDTPGISLIFRNIFLPWSRLNSFSLYPSDKLGSKVTKQIINDTAFRDRLTLHGLYVPKNKESRFFQFEEAYKISSQVDAIMKSIERSQRNGTLSKGRLISKIKEALEKDIIQIADASLLASYQTIHDDIVAVDTYKV
jgi:acyl-CoA dehydrogenase